MSGAPEKSNRRLGLLLTGLVAGMFGFGFAMVPLYTLVCNAVGINQVGGRVAESEVADGPVDESRTVRVEFDSTINAGLDWKVEPKVKWLDVHPGKVYEVYYSARNDSDHEVVAQAIPGITPWQATEHFHKVECFCFNQQKLAPGEAADLKLRFVLSPALPEQFHEVTLSYTFMDTDGERLRHAVSKR